MLQRVSTVVQPVRQLVGFKKMEFAAGEEKEVSIELDFVRYLSILNRKWEWEFEQG